jgi:hypothetical protein
MFVIVFGMLLRIAFTLSAPLSPLLEEGLWTLTDFPTTVPKEDSIRLDVYTQQPVRRSRGVLHLFSHEREHTFTYEQFQKDLQCPVSQPDINGPNGAISFLRLMPLTKQHLKILCAFAELSNIDNVPDTMDRPQDMIPQYEQNQGFDINNPVQTNYRLYRVINNTLHYDWPWGIERMDRESHQIELGFGGMGLFHTILKYVNDIGDNIFFYGCEHATLPWNIASPFLSYSPAVGYNHIPFPWKEAHMSEERAYQGAINTAKDPTNLTDEDFHMHIPFKSWEDRENKAAFFASLHPSRNIFFEFGRLYPEHFSMGTDCTQNQNSAPSFNPADRDVPFLTKEQLENGHRYNDSQPQNDSSTIGLASNILYYCDKPSTYSPGHFKYVIVPVGINELAGSGRLAFLLAHSGAVILLREGFPRHFFSACLKPWVHYVPLSFSGSDLLEKVLWLKQNDALAKQIAANGHAFGKSYLRLEDYLCYMSTTMRLLSELQKKSDVLEAFTPGLIKSHAD